MNKKYNIFCVAFILSTWSISFILFIYLIISIIILLTYCIISIYILLYCFSFSTFSRFLRYSFTNLQWIYILSNFIIFSRLNVFFKMTYLYSNPDFMIYDFIQRNKVISLLIIIWYSLYIFFKINRIINFINLENKFKHIFFERLIFILSKVIK